MVNLEEKEGSFEKVLFGFYDPNVLPDYVDSLYTQDKIDEFFIGTTMWLMPDIEKEERLYIAFKDKEANAEDVNIDLNPLEQEPFPSLDFQNVNLANTTNLETYAHDVSIEYTQLQLMEEMDKKKFILKVIDEADNKKLIDKSKKEIAIKKAYTLFDEANEIGIESEFGVYHYIACSLAINRSIKETALCEQMLKKDSAEEKEELLEQSMDDIMQDRGGNHGT